MNKYKRSIVSKGKDRIVEGVSIKRDADFAILFERKSYLDLFKKEFSIAEDNVDLCDVGGREFAHYELENGAIVVATFVQGTAFSASLVERLVRSGVSHIVRIGTCGSLTSEVNIWDIALNEFSVSNSSVSIDYKTERRSFKRTLLDELISPLGKMHNTYKSIPSIIKKLLKKIGKDYYEHYKSYSDPLLNDILEQNITCLLNGKSDFNFYRTGNYTTSTRYLEKSDIIDRLIDELCISTIDMETSSILACAQYHDVSASSISIIIDSSSPAASEEPFFGGHLKTQLLGIVDHELYRKIIPNKIIFCTKAVLKTFENLG